MYRAQVWIRYLVIFFNFLLIFWLLFSDRLRVPMWLMVAGRMHPVVLHFPLVLWMLWAIWIGGLNKQIKDTAQRNRFDGFFLSATVLVTTLTALSGFVLSREDGYEGDLLQWHLYLGAGLSVLGMLLQFFTEYYPRLRFSGIVLPVLAIMSVLAVGHTGASITHGSGFLTAPLQQKEELPPVPFSEALVFDHGVLQVLESKCFSCHNEDKRKGELLMTSRAGLLAGGKNGSLWDTLNPAASLLLQRIHLPPENEEHMPPKGKLQLTNEEKMLLDTWIEMGASFTLLFSNLPQDHALYTWAKNKYGSDAKADIAYEYPEYDPALIKKLSNQHRMVAPIEPEDNALSVQFYGSSGFSEESLTALSPLRRQIAHLNLSGMPLTDDMMKLIASFEGLQVLHLNHTPVTAKGLTYINRMKYLRKISLNATSLKENDFRLLIELPSLQTVYAGNTGLHAAGIQNLTKLQPAVQWVTGPELDTLVLQLNPPIIDHVQKVFTGVLPLKIRHPIQGVSIRYTLDGTLPDSIQSPLYSDSLKINHSAVLKVRAFKKGWMGSSTSEAGFFKRHFTADSVALTHAPNPNYAGNGAATLQDGQLSEKNFKSGLWVGFKDSPFEATLYFNKPIMANSVSLSSLVDIGSYIMPPSFVEVWGISPESNDWKLLGRTQPEQPVQVKPSYLSAVQVHFSPATYTRLRIKVQPVSKLPVWHPGKGDKGWFFTDEIFIN